MKNIQTLKGFRDFLPVEARKRAWLKSKMISVVEKWGYEPLETPTLEPLELFAGFIGEDEKLFFHFTDQGGREVALRYDQTVPTVRVLGQYYGVLTFPFRRYQIQSAFRAEKPQKGRYREFTQFDIDIYGIASPLADAEVIACNLDICRSIGFKKAKALISTRSLLKDFPYEAIVAIDKLKKIGDDGVVADMVSKGITEDKAVKYLNIVKNLQPNEEVKIIFNYLKNAGFSDDWYEFEPTLARSFSYSQGPIWEIVIPEYTSGSIGGGERYDGMMKTITGKDIPATGIAFGFDRTLEAAETCGLLPSFSVSTQILITDFSANSFAASVELSNKLRQNDIKTETYPDPSVKLDKQLKYADRKGIPFVVIQGPDELAKNIVKLKNMKTQEQTELTTDELIAKLKSSV